MIENNLIGYLKGTQPYKLRQKIKFSKDAYEIGDLLQTTTIKNE